MVKRPRTGEAEDDVADCGALEEDPKLSNMRKPELEQLAKDLSLPADGTRATLILRINKAREASKAKLPIACAQLVPTATDLHTNSAVDDGWARALAVRTSIVLADVAISWASGSVLLSPAMWTVMFWRHPVEVDAIYGPYGTEGPLMRTIRERWRRLLPTANEAQLTQMSEDFASK